MIVEVLTSCGKIDFAKSVSASMIADREILISSAVDILLAQSVRIGLPVTESHEIERRESEIDEVTGSVRSVLTQNVTASFIEDFIDSYMYICE